MRIFGVDIGITSIGFAVLDFAGPGKPAQIQRLGVRIFPEARDPDGTPLNQQRRAKRMMRRQLRRRRDRRRSFNEMLYSAALLPALTTPEWSKVMALDPYVLRERGLTQRLTANELGRALYHLAKRRHFKERDLAETEAVGEDRTQNAEEKLETAERESFVTSLRKSGLTLGQFLAQRGQHERRRGVHATRAVVMEEFNQLWEAQAAYHPALQDRALHGAIEEAIFNQRPVFWRKSTLGSCRLVPGAPLCPKGSWLSQQRRMLEKVNNLAIVGGNNRTLQPDEREAIFRALQTQKNMSWAGVRKALEPIFKMRGESAKGIRFNLEYGDERGGLKGNMVEAELAKVFGSLWFDHPSKEKLRQFLPKALWEADYEELGTQRVVIRPEPERAQRKKVLASVLVQDFGVSQEKAAALVKLSFPQGWEPFSTNALEAFLPELENGERFGALLHGPDYEAWRDRHFPDRERPTGEMLDKLPSPKNREEARRIARVRNPTVVRVQNELRKVINNLISVYGKPDLIRLELARDVGKSKREREEMALAMRKQERRRNDARKDLESKGIDAPSREDIEKWLLWKESSETCPYTGKKIGFDDLFRAGNFEIEHIWPRSLSLDNSFKNKTLCEKSVNIAKGNRIPFEFFRGREEDWMQVKERVWKMVGRDGMSPGKAKRFVAETIPDDFQNRQLNDTSYAAREARAYLQRLWPDVGPTSPVHVQPVSGRVTAQLRRLWGLNNLLSDDGEKTRADHRHHAIDALVVACASPSYTEKLSNWFKAKEDGKHPLLPEPWSTIRKDAEEEIAKIVVSHRVRKKVSGPLHKETTYGDTGQDVRVDRINYRVIVSRVPITELSLNDIEADDVTVSRYVVRDPAIRRALREHVAAFDGDLKKALSNAPSLGPEGPKIHKVRVISKRQIEGMRYAHNGLVDPEAKHHVAIFRRLDGSHLSEIVSVFDAAKRISARMPLFSRRSEVGATFVMSLAKGDIVTLSDERANHWVVREIKSNGQITLVPHYDARPTKQAVAFKPTVAGLMKLGPRKVSVDPIGRIRPAKD